MVRLCTPLAAVASELRSVVSEASPSFLASFTRVLAEPRMTRALVALILATVLTNRTVVIYHRRKST